MGEKEKADQNKVTYITIYIHEPKQITETKDNVISKSSGNVRVRGFHKKEKRWLTLSYMIPITNLGVEESADKKEILDKLLNPNSIINKDTKSLLVKLLEQYGPIKQKGRDRLEYKTERFKKKWKMKVRCVGGP